MVDIDTTLLICGGGPAALVAARIASSRSVASLVVGHVASDSTEPEVLDEASVAGLGPSLDVLRPYLVAQEPPTLPAAVFEDVLKHHCVADMNVTIYDGIELVDGIPDGVGLSGVLTDGEGAHRWGVRCDGFVDTSAMPISLNGAVAAAREALVAIDPALG